LAAQRAIGFGLESLPRIVRGQGSCLFDSAGRRYLDGSGGPAAFCIGHAHPEVNAAIAEQLGRVACAYRYLFTTDALEELTRLLLGKSGDGSGQVVYCGSGSEAMESALKVALQYWHARGRPLKTRFISRRRSYHGNTLGALSLSGFAERRRPFEGSLLDVTFVSAASAYRPVNDVDPRTLAEVLAAELEQSILSIGPERVAGFVFEPVVGAAGGVVPAPEGYVQAIRAVCDRHDVLLIADEVMCGSGRCGTWLALDHERVSADITAVAKGLAGGYIPLGATLFSATISNTIAAEHGAVLTGHTYSGHTAACAAGLAVQHIIERDRLLDRVRSRGPELQSSLRAALARFDEVGDVRGRGYFIGIELVRDPVSKEPFPAARGLSHAIGRRAFENGLICYPCAGHVGEGRGDTIVLAPPFNATDAELSELVEKLTRSVGEELAAG
jgi:adenosylmethionine-8-amino-7-oxononanoate aminotransferase